MTMEIKLTKGMVAIVDDCDFQNANGYRWRALKSRNTFYAVARIDRRQTYLHRLIMNVPDNIKIDHRDGNGMNCTRYNLRIATNSQNAMNRGKSRSNKSGFKGVSFHKRRNEYEAGIFKDGIRYFLGWHDNPEDAAHAYDLAAKVLFGEFAYVNFTQEDVPEQVLQVL